MRLFPCVATRRHAGSAHSPGCRVVALVVCCAMRSVCKGRLAGSRLQLLCFGRTCSLSRWIPCGSTSGSASAMPAMSGSVSDIATRVFHFSVILISKLITHKIRPLVCACLASESQEFPSMVISLRSRCEDAFTSSPGAAVIPFPLRCFSRSPQR